MIVSLKLDDDLYAKYAKRNPQNPRKALEEALEFWQDQEPGIPRLLVDGKDLRELKSISGPLDSSKDLLAWAKKHAAVSVEGVEVPLTLGQRQRLASMAEFFKEPLGGYVQKQFNQLLVRELGA